MHNILGIYLASYKRPLKVTCAWEIIWVPCGSGFSGINVAAEHIRYSNPVKLISFKLKTRFCYQNNIPNLFNLDIFCKCTNIL